jgi:hypothetical protein
MSARYGEPRRQAQLELRAAAAQIVVEAELVLRSLDELAGTPPPSPCWSATTPTSCAAYAPRGGAASPHQPRTAGFRRARRARAAGPRPSKPRSGSPPTEQHARPRLTIPIVGDPDKPKPARHPSRNADATDAEAGLADGPQPDS